MRYVYCLVVAVSLAAHFEVASSQVSHVGTSKQATQRRPCDGAATQADLNDCFSKLALGADARLKVAYDRYLRSLTGEDKADLVNAEEAWLHYRQAECKVSAGGSKGGSEYPMNFDICVNEMTLARIREIKADYKQTDH